MGLSLQVDLRSPTAVYRQIANALRFLLVGGALKPGDALPTVRQLAIDLGLNHNTVAEAYRILAEEGWLDLRRRHGVTVLERPQPPAERGDLEVFARRLRELVAEGRSAGVSVAAIRHELQQVGDELPSGGEP